MRNKRDRQKEWRDIVVGIIVYQKKAQKYTQIGKIRPELNKCHIATGLEQR